MFNFFSQLNRLERQRLKSLKSCDLISRDHESLADFLSQPLVPLPEDIDDQSLLAIDLETSGLNPSKDMILSIGGVEISGGKVQLATAFHQIIAVRQTLEADNVAIHGIRDQDLSQGLPLKTVLLDLLSSIKGKHLLVHFADIERNFLTAAYRDSFGLDIPFQFVDTFEIGKRSLTKKDIPLTKTHLSLSGMRQRQGLPSFEPHNALNDAIATAELYLSLKKNNN